MPAPPRPWLFPSSMLMLGLVIRAAWSTLQVRGHAMGEISNVAVAFANTGTLADAFHAGQGATAHVLPLSPVYAGLIYRWLGVQSPAAEAVLGGTSILIILAGFGLLYLIFGQIGTPRWARLAGLAFACLIPINAYLEVVDFRIWEGGLAVLISLAVLYALQRIDLKETLTTGTIAAMAMVLAVLFFVNPPLALGGYAGALLLMVDKLPWRRWPLALAIAAAALFLIIGPWSARNEAMLGEPVLLRSNAGLELAIANHPAAAAATDATARDVFRARLKEVHPFESDVAYAALQRAGGEVAYAHLLGARTKAWIAAHPGDFIRLSLRHLREYFFPPVWFWHIYNNTNAGFTPTIYMAWALSFAGLMGATAAAIVAAKNYRYALLMLILPTIPYMVVQPVLRYRYLIYGLSLFFAADLAGRLLKYLPDLQGHAAFGLVRRRRPAAA